MSYAPPPLPKVGDRIHKRCGARSVPGVVLAIVDESALGKVYAARFYWRKWSGRGRHTWECFNAYEWELGLFRPGPVPKEQR